MIRHRVVAPDGHTVAVTTSREVAEWYRRDGSTIATEAVEPVGRFGDVVSGRVVWADGCVSGVGRSPDPADAVPLIPQPAAGLLATIYGSDGPSCEEIGGPLAVAAVRECTTTTVARDPRPTRGGYQSPRVERLDVVLSDGSRRTWYAASVGYSEGYLYVLQPTYEAAVAELENYDAQLEPSDPAVVSNTTC